MNTNCRCELWLLFLFAGVVCQGCQPRPTVSKIRVRYTLGNAIAQVQGTGAADLGNAVPREHVPGVISGDSTHPSHLDAALYEDGESEREEVVWLRVPSPGFSSTETLVVSQITYAAGDLIVDYTKTTPGENTADFQQFDTVVRVTFAHP